MDLKHLFTWGLLSLAAASVLTRVCLPAQRHRHPVLHWATDDSPVKRWEIAPFKSWLRRHRYPVFTIRIDSANDTSAKDLIEGISGDGDDLMDMYGFGQADFMQRCGLLHNVASEAGKMDFGADRTWSGLRAQILHAGKQYLFPDNASPLLYWVDRATFAKYHQPVPPRRWTFAEFQRRGLAFVRAANPPGRRRKIFFANAVDTRFMRRSLGLSIFNETLTRCILDDPRYIRVLRLMRRWIFRDRLLPTPAELSALATRPIALGFGGSSIQLFSVGRCAMLYTGLWGLVQLRRFYRTRGAIPLAVSDPPCGGFPNAVMVMRGTAIYRGSTHKELAAYFLAYLASRTYNLRVVEAADSLPPIPRYTWRRRFLNPPQYPNEAGCAAAFARAARAIGIPTVQSPFILGATVNRIVRTEAEGGFVAGIYTARQAARLAAKRINQHIASNVRRSRRLGELYETLRRQQRTIDDLRQERRNVPLRLIRNPFYRRYYVAQGWASDVSTTAAGYDIQKHIIKGP